MGTCATFHPKPKPKKSSYDDSNLRVQTKGGDIIIYRNGLRIIKNNQTGKLQGVPQDWINKYTFTFGVDKDKTMKTQNVPTDMRVNTKIEEPLPEAISQMTDKQKYPQRGRKKVPNLFNLYPDNQSPYGIINLTSQLIQILQKFKIEPQDCKKNADIYIQVLNLYYQQFQEKKQTQAPHFFISGEQHHTKLENISFIDKNPARYFKFYHELGKGGSCKVFLSKCLKNNKYYAVRVLKIKDQKQMDKITQQITVMKEMVSKQVIKYHCTFKHKGLLFMFIEYMKRGSLTELIFKMAQKKIKFTQDIIAYIIKQILLGLKSLHEKQQIHRDIKSDNVLLGQNGEIKIADFGYAIQLTKQKEKRISIVGTPAWMAPQLILKKQYNESVDIWSLGILAMQLCNGQPPFFQNQHLLTLKKIINQSIPSVEGFSVQLKSFIDMCLQRDPKFRLSYKQLLNHPFILTIKNQIKMKNKLKSMLDDLYGEIKINENVSTIVPQIQDKNQLKVQQHKK